MTKYYRYWALILIIIGSLIGMMLPAPYGQNLAYHNFADARLIVNIPNMMDVITNFAFLLVGILGLIQVIKHREQFAPYSWIVMFTGISLVSIGSAYYHWNPNNSTLVWDRLPMTIGFMGLFIALLTEYADRRIEKFLLVPAVLIGLISVIYWNYTDDLRFYYWVQLVPLLSIPTTMILFKRRHTHASYLLIALICYILAKMSESLDRQIFELLGENISGHSVKHIIAAIGIYYIVLMVKVRKLKKEI